MFPFYDLMKLVLLANEQFNCPKIKKLNFYLDHVMLSLRISFILSLLMES